MTICVFRPCRKCKRQTMTILKAKQPKTTLCSECADKSKRSKP